MVNVRSMLGGRMELLAFVATALLSQQCAQASDITSDPFTPGGNIIPLTSTHPAFGAEAPQNSLSYAVDSSDRNSSGSYASENREASSSVDLQRLESFFKSPMITNYQQLTKYSKGAASTAPWPSSYWPIYEDGINYVWNKQDKMPPSEKYARAYGLDPQAFVTKISQTSGILSQTSRQSCRSDSDCSSLKDGSGCGKRTGQSSGYCIPKWFGVCHAWAPAAIEEREPRCPVTKNGVTFQVFDIKALVTQLYDGANLGTVFTGSRFNGADAPANVDSDGRYKDATRRDMGAGFFHIALLNIMGARQSSFIVDVDAGAQVWNQPARSYEVISTTELTPAAAAQTFFPPRTSYTFNSAAKKIVFVQLKFNYIVEGAEDGPLVSTNRVDAYTTTVYYEYCLELDGSGNIIGGEWVRNSRTTHPDFLWFPESTPTMGTVSDIGIKYKDVRELLDASADCKVIDGPATPAVTTTPSVTATPPGTITGAPPSVTVQPISPVAPPPAATPAFSIGTVISADTLGDAYNSIAEMIKRWMGGLGSGH